MPAFSLLTYVAVLLTGSCQTAEAASLRAQAPDRSITFPASSDPSPAAVEEQEEEEVEDRSDESASGPTFAAPEALASQAFSTSPALEGQQLQRDALAGQLLPSASLIEQSQLGAAVPHHLSQARAETGALASSATPRAQSPHTAVKKVSHPTTVPQWQWAPVNRSQEASFQSIPTNWPPLDNKYNHCDPPCVQGRGICNDRVCFCKSPFTGSTCQHKISALYRAPKVMVVGFSIICVLVGILSARMVLHLCSATADTRMHQFGEMAPRIETWQPPEEDNKKKKVNVKK